MSTETITAPPTTEAVPPMPPETAKPRALYWRLWKNVPRELLFHLLSFPIALTAFILTITLFSSGVGTLVTFIGLFIVVAALYVSRGFGIVELAMLEWVKQPRIERPEWQDARARTGFGGWLMALFGNGHYWLYLLHTMIVNFIVTLVTWTITIVWVSFAVAPLIPWAWATDASDRDGNFFLANWVLGFWGNSASGTDLLILENVFGVILGLFAIATLPFITRGIAIVRHQIARGMLGSFKSDALQRQVIDLTVSRGAAQSAEGHSLRRLERDIHDGPQQRLVRQQMDLAAAERQLDSNPEAARALIASAMVQSREALEELRALSRGFAPPILLDRGLVAALESAGVRSAVPVRIVSELPEGIDLPQEIERNAYFAGSEALANAAKHSGATDIEVRVGVHRNPESDDSWLDVIVTDNGRGGAVMVQGHGLAGLDERLRGLGGVLTVASPAGGPTIVSAHFPLTTVLTTTLAASV